MVNGEEDETIWVYLEERFGSKTSVHFGRRRLLVSRRVRQDGSGPHASGRSGIGVQGLRRRATSKFQYYLLEAS